jgi:N-acetylmuramoyl-L-alanine amidase
MGKYSCHGGHNAIVNGANWGNRKEHVMDRQVKDAVIAKLRQLGHTAYDDTDEVGSTQAQNLNNIVAKCNSHDVDLVISFHLNAFNGSANGVEVLYFDQEALAAKVSAQLAKDIGWYNRGAKPRTDLAVLKGTKAPAILIELGFIDNDADMAKWNVDKIANSIVFALTGQTVSGGSTGGNVAPLTNDLKAVATGGIGFDRMKEVSEFLNTLGYGASIVISGKGDGTFFIRSDRRVGSDLDKLTAWLDVRSWWYQYE